MKKFRGISSLLLLSSVLANPLLSTAIAAEETKMVDTTGEKQQKDSDSDKASDSSSDKKGARDVETTATSGETTEDSHAINEREGEVSLQDPTASIMDHITDDSNVKAEMDETKEEQKDDKKENKEETKEDEAKKEEDQKAQEILKEATPEGLLNGSTRAHPLADWNYETKTVDGHGVVVLKSLKNPSASTVTVPSSYYTESVWGTAIKPCYVNKDAFKGNKNIRTVIFDKKFESDYSKLYDPKTGKSTTDMSHMFSNMPNLTRVDFSGINIQGAQNFSHMFSGDTSLTTLDGLSTLDTSQGTDFTNMFENCKGLKRLDLRNWDFKSAQNMSNMFLNCRNLIELRLKGLPNGVNLGSICHNAPVIYAEIMFARSNYLASNVGGAFMLDYGQFPYLPLLIHSNSQTFLTKKLGTTDSQYYTYSRFANDGRTLPFILDSGQGLFREHSYVGQFDIGMGVHYRDEKICMLNGITNGYATTVDPISQLSNAKQTIQKVLDTIKPYPTIQEDKNPVREDKSRFFNNYYKDETQQRMNGWKPRFKDAPAYLKNIFAKVTAQYAPVNPEMASGHVIDSKNPNSKKWPDNRMPQGELGFCYQPDTLTTKTDVVLDNKDKSTPLVSDSQHNFHLGVRDYTNTPTPWSVNATLDWDTPKLNDATIQGTGGPIKKNMNNINNKTNAPKPFKDSQLNNYGDGNVTSLISSGFILQGGKQMQLMKSDGKQAQNFYDLTLGNLTLNTKDNGRISPGSYEGQINWNMTKGPNG